MKFIKEIEAIEDYQLLVEFENQEKKIFDIKPYLNDEVFSELKDIEYFNQVKNGKYFIYWPNEQDLSGDTLYLDGESIELNDSCVTK